VNGWRNFSSADFWLNLFFRQQWRPNSATDWSRSPYEQPTAPHARLLTSLASSTVLGYGYFDIVLMLLRPEAVQRLSVALFELRTV